MTSRVIKLTAVVAALPMLMVLQGQGYGGRRRGGNGAFGGNRNFGGYNNGYNGNNGDRGGTASKLPPQFAILDQVSIFARDRRSVDNGPKTQPAEQNVVRPSVPVFTGTIQTQTGDVTDHLAVIEDPNSGVTNLRVGDEAPKQAGKVTAITYNTMTLEKDGKSRTIPIGMNLEGQPPSPNGGSGGRYNRFGDGNGFGNFGNTGSATPDTGGDTSSIVERLRLRRLQELGGGGTVPAAPAGAAPAPTGR